MRQSRINSGKSWTSGEIQLVRKMAKQNKPTKLIASKLCRSTDAVRKKASEKHISLKVKTKSTTYKSASTTRSKTKSSNGGKRRYYN